MTHFPKRRGLVLVAVPSLLVVAAAALLAAGPRSAADQPGLDPLSPDPIDRAEPTSARAAERRLSEQPGAGTLYGAPPGRALEFELAHKSSVQLKATGTQGAPRCIDLRLVGRLRLVVADRREGQILVAVSMPNAELHSSVTSTPGLKQMAGALAGESFLRLDEEGRPLGLRFPQEMAAHTRSLLRGVLAAFSFVVPAEAAERYETEEQDMTGRFAAAYEWKSDGRLERRKLRYLDFGPDRDQREHELRATATTRFSKDAAWLAEADVVERLNLQLAEVSSKVSSFVRAKLRLASYADLPREQWPKADWDGHWIPIVQPKDEGDSVAERNLREVRRADLEGVTLNQLIDQIEALVAAGKHDSFDLYVAWDRLKWMLLLDHEKVSELLTRVRSGAGLSPRGRDLLITAMGAAGNGTAQTALLALQADTILPRRVRESATVAMFQLDAPQRDVYQALLARSRNVGAGDEIDAISMRALGRLSRRSSDPIDASGHSALDSLLELEADCRRSGRTDVWLQSLGNSRSPRILPRVEHYLASSDSEQRRHAVAALRHVQTPEALALVRQRALRDEDAQVREAAAEVLAETDTPDARRVLRRCALEDRSPGVRYRAVLALAQHGPQDAESWSTLRHVAAQDANARLRAFARKLLTEKSK